jgi:hypothetical protein
MLVPLAYLVLACDSFLKQERRDPKNQTNLVPDETRPAHQSSALGSCQVQRLHVLDHESYHDVTVEKISPKTLGDSNNAILPPKNSTARSGCNAEHDSHFTKDHDAVFRQRSAVDPAGDSAVDSAVDTVFFSGVFTWILDGPTAESPAIAAAAADCPSEEDIADPFHDDWPYWDQECP